MQWLLTKAAEPNSICAESVPEYKALERVAAQNCVVISILAKQSDTGEKVCAWGLSDLPNLLLWG